MNTVPCKCDDCGAVGEMEQNGKLLNGWERQGWFQPGQPCHISTRCPECHQKWDTKGPPPRIDPYKPVNIGK